MNYTERRLLSISHILSKYWQNTGGHLNKKMAAFDSDRSKSDDLALMCF
jgi:hypothetical protein